MASFHSVLVFGTGLPKLPWTGWAIRGNHPHKYARALCDFEDSDDLFRGNSLLEEVHKCSLWQRQSFVLDLLTPDKEMELRYDVLVGLLEHLPEDIGHVAFGFDKPVPGATEILELDLERTRAAHGRDNAELQRVQDATRDVMLQLGMLRDRFTLGFKPAFRLRFRLIAPSTFPHELGEGLELVYQGGGGALFLRVKETHLGALRCVDHYHARDKAHAVCTLRKELCHVAGLGAREDVELGFRDLYLLSNSPLALSVDLRVVIDMVEVGKELEIVCGEEHAEFGDNHEQRVVLHQLVGEDKLAFCVNERVHEACFAHVDRSDVEVVSFLPELTHWVDRHVLAHAGSPNQHDIEVREERAPRGFHPDPTFERSGDTADTRPQPIDVRRGAAFGVVEEGSDKIRQGTITIVLWVGVRGRLRPGLWFFFTA